MSISPEVLQRLLDEGLAKIARLKARIRYDEDGVMLLPAPCELCERDVTDIALMTADGLPICNPCFNGTVDGNVGVTT